MIGSLEDCACTGVAGPMPAAPTATAVTTARAFMARARCRFGTEFPVSFIPTAASRPDWREASEAARGGQRGLRSRVSHDMRLYGVPASRGIRRERGGTHGKTT